MIDVNSQFFALLTKVGEAKQANADALGIPWKITEMGVGDANGTDPVPDRLQTTLINEWRRRPLNQLKIDPVNPAVLIAEQVIPADEGGKWIREIGLYDADGDLVAVANCAPSFKPILSQGSGRTQIVRMNFVVTSAGNITLKIDPAVVLATREYVDTKILEELYKLDSKQSVRVATTANIALAGLQTLDGVALLAGDRVLVKNQAQAKENGLYLSAVGAWARTQDADVSLEVTPGLFVHVEKGTANGDSVWQLTTDAPITLGTTDLQFEMVAGRTGVSTGTYRSVTVDANGRVIGGTNPTTLAGYGIDPATKAEAESGDNAKPLTAQGALWVLGKVKGFAKFTANGSFTVPAGVTQIWLSGCAGGGGGGSGSGGTSSSRGSGGGSGGAGQNIQKDLYAVTPGQVIPITIGSGGSGGAGVGTQNAVGNVGTNGGNTIIGSLVTLTAGGGGSYGTDGTGGTRGAGWPNGSHGSDGTLAGVGGGSGDGHVGASGPFGGGGGGSRAVGSSASNASGYGSGGGGGAGGGAPGTPSSNGGNGSPGLVLIEY